MAIGAFAAARWVPQLSQRLRGARRPRYLLFAYVLVLALWAWRPFPNWGWLLASGLIGILLAIYLLSSLPITAIWLLGFLVGVLLISEGVALGYLAWRVRES